MAGLGGGRRGWGGCSRCGRGPKWEFHNSAGVQEKLMGPEGHQAARGTEQCRLFSQYHSMVLTGVLDRGLGLTGSDVTDSPAEAGDSAKLKGKMRLEL